MNTVARILKKVSSSESFPESSLPPYKPIPKVQLTRESSLPRLEVDRPGTPLSRQNSGNLSRNSTSSRSSSPYPLEQSVLHNDDYSYDRGQKLPPNTKKIRGLRSFLWIKPPASSSSSFLSQLLPSLATNLGSLSTGLSLAYSAILLPSITQEDNLSTPLTNSSVPMIVTLPPIFSITQETGSWIASIFWLGAVLGGVLGRWLAPLYGRRVSLLLLTLPDLLGWTLLACPPTLPTLFIGRLLTGVAAGGYHPNIQQLVVETVQPQHLSLLSSLPLPATALGSLITFTLGLFLTPTTTALVCVVVPGLLILALAFIWDSPHWYLSSGQEQTALTALESVRGGQTATAVSEMINIQRKIDKQMKSPSFSNGMKRIFSEHFKTIGMINVFFLLLVFSGKFSIDFYLIELLQKAGGHLNEHLSAVIISLLHLGGCVVFSLFNKRFSRKSLFLVSSLTGGFSLALFGLSLYHHLLQPTSTSLSLLPLASLSLFMLATPLGLESIPFSLLAESFPPELRHLTSSLTLGLACLELLLATKLLPTLQMWLSPHSLVWLYAGGCFFAALLGLNLVVEEKEVEVEQDKFAGLRKDKTNPWVSPIHCTEVSAI